MGIRLERGAMTILERPVELSESQRAGTLRSKFHDPVS